METKRHKWFPGNYSNTCYKCKSEFHMADKLCFICEPCCNIEVFNRYAENAEDGLDEGLNHDLGNPAIKTIQG